MTVHHVSILRHIRVPPFVPGPTPQALALDLAVKRVARALLGVRAALPASDGREFPVLTSDPDFDDLPLDHTEGTEDDDLTQEAVLRLARAAVIACGIAVS
jgi:hypothetical protein